MAIDAAHTFNILQKAISNKSYVCCECMKRLVVLFKIECKRIFVDIPKPEPRARNSGVEFADVKLQGFGFRRASAFHLPLNANKRELERNFLNDVSLIILRNLRLIKTST